MNSLSVSSAAEILGVTDQKLREMTNKGLIPSTVTESGHRRYSPKVLQNFVDHTRIEWLIKYDSLKPLPEKIDFFGIRLDGINRFMIDIAHYKKVGQCNMYAEQVRNEIIFHDDNNKTGTLIGYGTEFPIPKFRKDGTLLIFGMESENKAAKYIEDSFMMSDERMEKIMSLWSKYDYDELWKSIPKSIVSEEIIEQTPELTRIGFIKYEEI